LVSERLLHAFNLANDGRGRRAYVAWLEARATNDGGKIDEKASQAIRRGWYLGKDSFKDKLLKMLERPSMRGRGGTGRAPGGNRNNGEKEASRILREGIRQLGLPSSMAVLSGLRKSDARKARLAILLRTHTSMSNDWIATKLAMGHPGSVSRVVSAGRSDKSMTGAIRELAAMLIREL